MSDKYGVRYDNRWAAVGYLVRAATAGCWDGWCWLPVVWAPDVLIPPTVSSAVLLHRRHSGPAPAHSPLRLAHRPVRRRSGITGGKTGVDAAAAGMPPLPGATG